MRRFEPDLLRVCFCVCKVQWVTDRLKNVIQVHNNNKMKSSCVEIIGPDGMAHKWVSPFWHLIFMRSVLCIVYKRWLVYFVCFGDRISLMPDSYAKAHATYRVALGPMQFFVCAMLFVCFIEPCVLWWRWRKQDSAFSGSYLRYIRSATGLLYLYLHWSSAAILEINVTNYMYTLKVSKSSICLHAVELNTGQIPFDFLPFNISYS